MRGVELVLVARSIRGRPGPCDAAPRIALGCHQCPVSSSAEPRWPPSLHRRATFLRICAGRLSGTQSACYPTDVLLQANGEVIDSMSVSTTLGAGSRVTPLDLGRKIHAAASG